MAEIVKTDPHRRMVYGWAYVAKDANGAQVIDHSGDVIDDPEELEKAAVDFVVNSRNGDSDHDNKPKAVLVESLYLDKAKAESMGLDCPVPTAWWVGFRINDEPMWQRVLKGELTSFSIGGSGLRTALEEAAL
jgi:hypothetical protein